MPEKGKTRKTSIKARPQKRKTKRKDSHLLDLIMMIVLPLFATIYTISFKPSFLLAAILFLVLPALWLSLRRTELIIKSGIFGLVFALPLSFVVDYLAVRDGSWYIPHSLFPRLLGNVVVVEDILWMFFFVYFVVVFYEYFFDSLGKEHMTPRLKNLLYITLSVTFLFFIVYANSPELLEIPYAYLVMGITLCLIPLILIFIKLPRLIHKFLGVTAYFFLFCLLYEVAGLKAGLWIFPGQNFIGSISLFGVNFPIEEAIFWMLLTAGTILAVYEYFDDDGK